MAKSVILIDFDNLFLNAHSLDPDTAFRFADYPSDWLRTLAGRHLALDERRWLVARCYLNPAGYVGRRDSASERSYFSRFRPGLVRAGFEVIDCPSMTANGKNAADIRIVVDAMQLLDHPAGYDEFVIGSSDSDFTPLLHRLRAADRRVTILSAGQSSPAYTSLADRLIDFEGLYALVRPESIKTEAPVDGVSPDGAADPGYAAFCEMVVADYRESAEPIHLSALAQKAAAVLPGARESHWFGRGSFAQALEGLGLPNAQIQANYLWDEERHQPPGIAAPSRSIGLPDPIATLGRVVELPKVTRERWPPLFAVLARYAAEHEFSLSESSRWSRDVLEDGGTPVARPAINFVVRGARFGGAPLNRTPPPTADEIAEAFVGNLLNRAEQGGVVLEPVAVAEVRAWFGLADGSEIKPPRREGSGDDATASAASPVTPATPRSPS